MNTERLYLDIDDATGVAHIILDHPPLNIYDLEMRDQLIEAVTAVRDIPDVRCLLLSAAGKNFSAGADLSEFGNAESIPQARRIRWDRDPWLPLANLPVPTLCALHGYVLGSGFEMSLYCDIRIAATNATLSLPEVKLGMLPGAGGTQSLPRVIGADATMPLLLTGRDIDAATALRLGIVTELVEPEALPLRAVELASELVAGVGSHGRLFTSRLRHCQRAASDMALAQGLVAERRLAWLVASSK